MLVRGWGSAPQAPDGSGKAFVSRLLQTRMKKLRAAQTHAPGSVQETIRAEIEELRCELIQLDRQYLPRPPKRVESNDTYHDLGLPRF